jgi:hypothetical protein
MKTKKDLFFQIKNMRFLQTINPNSIDCKVLENEIDKEVKAFFDKEVENSPIDIEKKRTECETRKKTFHDLLVPYVEYYGKDMITDFYFYWIEMNKSLTKMRFELQKTWDLKRRLNTWESRSGNFHKKEYKTTVSPENQKIYEEAKQKKEQEKRISEANLEKFKKTIPEGYNMLSWMHHLRGEAAKGDKKAIELLKIRW